MRAEATTCYRSQDGGILWRQRRSCRTLTYMQIFDIFATEHNELEQLRTGRHSAFSRLPIFSSVALHCEANQTCRSISSNQLAEKWIIKWTLMASHSMGKHQGESRNVPFCNATVASLGSIVYRVPSYRMSELEIREMRAPIYGTTDGAAITSVRTCFLVHQHQTVLRNLYTKKVAVS